MLLALTTLLGSLAATAVAATTSTSPRSCSSIAAPQIPGAKVLSVSSTELINSTVAAYPPLLNEAVTGINVCEAIVTLTHRGANYTVKGARGRLATARISIAPYAVQGFAAASTDAGLDGNLLDPSMWALKADGTVNTDLLTNFASRSVHDLAVVSKAVAAVSAPLGCKV
ncbi:hypothetical protein C8A00DRAFT_34097 [Chaetomidium leptoderma]|uniref:Uncharacterized protein n=1 Tax=Chaetomidium leptoderma TaxID=669021 RepID=A0AAN6VMX6_9PEZI|nr:hypothetical protein C8A00DRAFT_34097 [Chaetomidium leptoderma]